MSRDPLIHDLLEYHTARHEELGSLTDMVALAKAAGWKVRMGEHSMLLPDGTIQIAASKTRRERRFDTAHEISHALMLEGENGLSYHSAVHHFHASAPNIDDHEEALVYHGGDRLLMPDALVREIFTVCGRNAQAVWELSRFADVEIKDALRRIVTFDEAARVGGFFSAGGFIQLAETHQYDLPFWVGCRVPEPHIVSRHQISTFELPNQCRHLIGLVVMDEFEAA